MNDFGLLSICISAFTAVFLLLSVLAAIMRLIMKIFPETIAVTKKQSDTIEPAVIATIATTTAAFYPGANINKIEEIR